MPLRIASPTYIFLKETSPFRNTWSFHVQTCVNLFNDVTGIRHLVGVRRTPQVYNYAFFYFGQTLQRPLHKYLVQLGFGQCLVLILSRAKHVLAYPMTMT